jgi:hypothetical protein
MTFSNNSDQKERKAILKNDATTLHKFAQSEAGEIGGRFAKPATLNASQSAVHYPKLPTSSPWSSDPVPPEEPLGIDVSEAPIVGEPAEVEASLNAEFGWRRTIQDGVPPAAGQGHLIPAAPEPTPDSEVARTEEPARQPLPLSGRHSINPRGRGRVSPSNPIMRRLV